MVYDPSLGNRAWPGGPPLGALAAMAGHGVAPAAPAPPTEADLERVAAQQRAARERAEREERERRRHAARVAAHEAETGWGPGSAARVAVLSTRIAELAPRRPATFGHAVSATIVGVIDVALLATVLAGVVADNGVRAVLGLVGLTLMLWPTGWAAWVVVRLARQRRRRACLAEREALSRARGCGDRHCARCEG
jgi:hypothetical protein